MGKAESEVEKHLKQQVMVMGGLTRKWVSPGQRGVPDQIVFLYGEIFFAEIKAPNGILALHQKREIQRLREQGATVVILSSKEGVDRCLSYWKELHQPED